MGALRNIVKSADSSPQVEEEVKEALAMLVELAQEKATSAEKDIKLDLQTGKTTDNLSVPITKIIQSKVEYRALTSTSSDIIKDITSSIGEIFSGDGGILKGISGIANTALTAITGAGEGQESEVRIYNVVTEYPAIVRFDFYFWGRNTKAKSIMTQVKSAFACVGFKSAVDISKLDYNTFLSLYSPILRTAFGNDQQKLKEMINESKEVYNMFNEKHSIAPVKADTERIVQGLLNGNNLFKVPDIKIIN